MHRPTADPVLLRHYSVLVYPFRHQLVGDARLSRLASLEPRWRPWAARFTESDLAAKLEATGFFFPYVRDLLYPEIPWLRKQSPAEDYDDWAGLLKGWSDGGLFEVGRKLRSGVLRLTLQPQVHQALEEFVIHCPGSHGTRAAELPARFDWIDAQLFPSGVGFLLLKTQLTGGTSRLSQLIRLNQSVRKVLPPSRRTKLAELHTTSGARFTARELMGFLTQGLAEPWDLEESRRGEFPAPPDPCPRREPYADSEAGRTYGERCQLLSFACVDVSKADPEGLPKGEFPTGTDRLVFELAACIGLGESVAEPMWVPSKEGAAKYTRDNRISSWNCWTGMVLKDAVVFLGSEDIEYNKEGLPRLVENDYLPLYVYVLYQKLQLFTFSNELLREVALSDGRLSGARGLLERFVGFRSQYWFAEITRKPQGGEMYRTFQRGLEVQAMYDMVTGSVKDVKEFYEGQWARRVQALKDALTFGGPVLVGLGALRMALETSEFGWPLGLAALALGALLVLVMLRWRQARPVRRAVKKEGKEIVTRLAGLLVGDGDSPRRKRAG